MRTLLLAFAIAFPVCASEVFFMDLEDDMELAENIFLARVEEVWETPMSYMARMDYTLRVLEVISCSDSVTDSVVGAYSMVLPGPYVLDSGEEVWVSPIVNGSGMELYVEPGDTVIVLSGSVLSGSSAEPVTIIRLESPEYLENVKELLQH